MSQVVTKQQIYTPYYIQTEPELVTTATKQNMPKREHSTATSSMDSRSESSPSTLNKTDKGHDDTETIKRLKLELNEKLKEFNNLKKELNSTKEQLNTTMEQLKNREEWLRCILDKI